MKRVLKIAALPLAAVFILSIAAMFLGSTGSGTAAPSSTLAGKWCGGKKIVFFPGGPAGGVFAVNVYNGAKQAAADLGPNVQYVWSNWDPATMVSQLQVGHCDAPHRHRRDGTPG